MTTSPHFRAFTVVELFIVVAVIAILVALAMPVIVAQRRRAASAECAGTLSSIMKAHAVWSADHDDRWANLFSDLTWDVYTIENNHDLWGIGYYGQVRAWVATLSGYLWEKGQGGRTVSCPALYRSLSTNPDWDVFDERSFDASPLGAGFESYFYSSALISRADLWNPEDPRARENPNEFRAHVGVPEVWFPSSKVAMAECADHHGNRRPIFEPDWRAVNAAFADGHVRPIAATGTEPALVYNGDDGFPEGVPIPFNSGAWGARGRDVR